jgi:hypothetical protein
VTNHDMGRTSGRPVGLAAALGLLTVLVVGGGWLTLRGLQANPPPPPASAAAPVAGSQASATDLGVPGLVDGVPWGFPLDPAGATAAGVTVVTVTGQPQVAFDADRFGEVAGVMFTDEEAEVQARQVDAARINFELSGWAEQPESRRMYYLAPLAARLAAYDPAALTATVEVWAMTLVGVGDAGGAVFTTSTVELTAQPNGDTWVTVSLDTVEGPTPLVYDHPTAPGRTRSLVRDATPLLPLPLPDVTGDLAGHTR